MQDTLLEPTWRRSTTERKNDRRSRRTRAALTEALVELLAEKPLRSVTVTELTNRADVNRATFYVHYHDVFDMFDQVKEELLEVCADLVDAHAEEIAADSYEPLLRDIYTYFGTNESLFGVLSGRNADGGLLTQMIDTFYDRCMAAARPLKRAANAGWAGSDSEGNLPPANEAMCSYQFAYIAGGVVNVIKRWIETGKREPVDVMVPATVAFIGTNQNEVLQANLQLVR